jgi:hypothetical protein
MYRAKHPSGWDSGFFRLGAGPNDNHNQLFINLVTRQVEAMAHDTNLEGWEPLYIFMGNGKPEKVAKPAEVEAGPSGDPRYEYNLNDKQTGLLWAIYTNDAEAMQVGPTLAALTRRGLTVGHGKLELTELGKKVAKLLDTEADNPVT